MLEVATSKWPPVPEAQLTKIMLILECLLNLHDHPCSLTLQGTGGQGIRTWPDKPYSSIQI